MILGRDILESLGLTLNFTDKTVIWDGSTVPMKNPEFIKQQLNNYITDSFYWHNDLLESDALQSATERLKKISMLSTRKPTLRAFVITARI